MDAGDSIDTRDCCASAANPTNQMNGMENGNAICSTSSCMPTSSNEAQMHLKESNLEELGAAASSSHASG